LLYAFLGILKAKLMKKKAEKMMREPVREGKRYKLLRRALRALYQYAYV